MKKWDGATRVEWSASDAKTINDDLTMGGASCTLLAGRYRVVRSLGQGGMGSVWLAEDTKLDNFKVAIKMLPSVLVNNRRAYAQVKAEALVSLKLSHPNIATVRAFEEENGNPFLVMDYIEGQTLDDILAERGKLTEDETVKLLKPVAEALDYAHQQGVVHRDVKSGNVIIRKDGVPFVLDFGIAREIHETMTRVTGKLSSGTLMYMSPEQLNGASPKPAQDVYSFAAMAYECLKGEPPFSRGQIEYQIVNNKPEPLDPQFANCGPGVMAGLEKLPENRPASCAAVLALRHGNFGGRSSRLSAATRTKGNGQPVVQGGGKKMWIGVGLAALALAGAGLFRYASVKKAEQSRLSAAQVAFERARTSLKDCEEKLGAISREDGFGSRIDEIEEKIPSRITLRDAPSFLTAAECCDRLERDCRRLLTASEVRVRAKTARDTAQAAKQKAQGQYASQDAREAWQEAENAYGQGRREFVGFDFEKAQQFFVQSKQLYEKAAAEAIAVREERQKAERAQQEQKAKEDELLKRNERKEADQETSDRVVQRGVVGQPGTSRDVFDGISIQGQMKQTYLPFTFRHAVKIPSGWRLEFRCSELKDDYVRNGRMFTACIGEEIGDTGWVVESYTPKTEKRTIKGGNGLIATVDVSEVRIKRKLDGKSVVLSISRSNSARAPVDLVATIVLCAEDGERRELLAYVGASFVHNQNHFNVVDVSSSGVEIKDVTSGVKRLIRPGSATGPSVDAGKAEVERKEHEQSGRQHELKAGDTKTIALPGGATMEMVWCPPGSFMMGSPEAEDGRGGNETRHRVTLTQGFWIGKYEVTQQQWESVMGENPSSFKGADRPVEWVSWDDCQMFVRKVNDDGEVTLSLPTEAQWEYACRAGTATPFSFGQALNGDKANCDGSYPYGTTVRGRHRKETVSVGSYAPNAWGIYDMHGNVLEWCADRYGQYDGDVKNPMGATSGLCRVARGGGWDSYALCCRSASRSRYVPGLRDFYLGFRLVCSPEK